MPARSTRKGLCIPLMRFAREGKVDETLVEIVSANVREPIQVVGDLYSLATLQRHRLPPPDRG